MLATCPDEAAQADAVCDTIIEHLESGVALRDQAVLFRTGHHSDLVEVEMRRRRIPFVKFGGLRFLEAAHVRDLAALLRVLDNPWDELAWPRVLGMAEGVGPGALRRLLVQLGLGPPPPAGCPDGDAGGDAGGGDAGGGDAGGAPVGDIAGTAADPLTRFTSGGATGPPRARATLADVAAALDDCRRRPLDEGPAPQVERLLGVIEPIVRRRYDNGEVRVRDLQQLARLANGSPSRAALVADLVLDPPASSGDLAGPPHLDDDYVVLSTVHSAKGGEWEVVHVLHAVDGMFPSDMATGDDEGVDEERRLFYVALTRARRHLHVYAPVRYHHGGQARRGDRHTRAARSRFLPPEADHLLEHRAVRSSVEDRAEVASSEPLADAVHQHLAGLW